MRQEFLDALRAVLADEPGLAVIHSSIANLGPPPRFRKWDALYALEQLLKEGWTVALPAFTFSFCQGGPFRRLGSPSETGVLADWFLAECGDAIRTGHPIYSFAVAGPKASRICECRSTTTFGDDSPFDFFERENAWLVMLGCGWKFCTQFHRYEELATVPYRYFKEFKSRADLGDGAGEREVAAKMFVRELELDPSNDFAPAVERLRRKGHVKRQALWRGEVESAPAAAIACICRELLGADPLVFLRNGPEVADRMANRARAATQPALNVAVLGQSNLRLLRSAWERDLAAYLPDRRVEIYEAPYGQLRQSLLSETSPLGQLRPQFSVFCDRLEDLVGQWRLDEASPELLTELVSQYAETIANFHERNGGWSVVHRFPSLHYPAGGNQADSAALVGQLNGVMHERLAHLPQVVWVDVAAEAAGCQAVASEAKLWFLGRFPYSEEFSRRLARRWTGIFLATLGKTARVVAFDLDNTLWGGVLGEDGLEGIKIGGDYPGNAFAAFQRALKALTRRGIAVAVCSKNDEDLALRAMETLPAMIIRPADLVARRINWRAKWSNLQEIADELNLGVESILYVDDNPVEREAVRRNLPAAKILDLPADPTDYVEALMASPWIAAVNVTDEDRRRVDGYQALRQVRQSREASPSLEDFYTSLRMEVYFQPLDAGNMGRAAQLSQKTNQFNTTTRRYEQRDLCKAIDDGGEVIVIGLSDRYNSLENVGLLVLKPDPETCRGETIDNYLLSCRVLGRGLETAVLDWAVHHAAARDIKTVRGLIIETERNTPVRGVFRDAGFQPGAKPGEWVTQTETARPVPGWLTVIDRVAAVRASLD